MQLFSKLRSSSADSIGQVLAARMYDSVLPTGAKAKVCISLVIQILSIDIF